MKLHHDAESILSSINNRFNSSLDESVSIKEKRWLASGLPVIKYGLDYLPNNPPELDDTDDDSSISSNSVSTTSSKGKGVSFAAPLVTEVRFRPRTLKMNKSELYYTVQETARFRQEYREERSRLKQDEDDLDISPNSSALGEPRSYNRFSGESQGLLDPNQANSSNNDHRIYKIVVKHKNTLETFIDNEIGLSTITKSLPGKFKTANGDFFDNDSFWNGEITWY